MPLFTVTFEHLLVGAHVFMKHIIFLTCPQVGFCIGRHQKDREAGVFVIGSAFWICWLFVGEHGEVEVNSIAEHNKAVQKNVLPLRLALFLPLNPFMLCLSVFH